MIRKLAGLGLALIAAWLLWQGLHAIEVFMARGGSLASALFEPPSGIIRVASTALALLGGGLALAGRPGGAPLGVTGALGFAALGLLLASAGADISLWRDEALWSGALVPLALILVFTRRG